MAKPLSELTQNFSDERKARIEEGGNLLLMEYDLVSKLRQDRELTQKELADILEVRQSAVSKLEHQDDVLIQTLARYVRALGGELEIRAKFPDREVTLRQFTGREDLRARR